MGFYAVEVEFPGKMKRRLTQRRKRFEMIRTVVCMLALIAALAVAEEPAKPEIHGILVNGEKISAQKIEQYYQRTLLVMKRMNPAAVLKAEDLQKFAGDARMQAVRHAVIRQYVDASKIAITPEGIREEVNFARVGVEGTGLTLEELLKDRGQTEQEFEDEIAPLAALSQSCASGLDHGKLKLDFERNKSRIPVRRASHILFMHAKAQGTSQRVRAPEEARRLADEALAAARRGDDFVKLARECSDCPSKAQGGDLGWFLESAMVKPFADATFSLKKTGDLSGVIESPFGFHVIKLTGLRTEEEAYKSYVRQAAEAQASETINRLMREAKISKE